jgi:fermentation-respiration switch protein FrsA (DUF1100 family)
MIRIVATLLVTGGIVLALLSPLAERVIFQPTPGQDVEPALIAARYGFEAESLFLETEDGVRIHAYYVPARRAPAAPRGLLFLHGNAGNASHRLPNAAALAALGVDVLLLDYRGYGLSEGRPSEAGVYADARAGLAYLAKTRGIPPERTVVFGRSLGGAVAVELAQERPLAGLVLESTFTSVDDMARRMLGPFARFVGGGFASLERIPRLRAPLLFFHGDRDDIVPIDLGRALFAAAPEPKRFEVIAGAGHNDTVEVGGAAYLARLGSFFDEVAP